MPRTLPRHEPPLRCTLRPSARRARIVAACVTVIAALSSTTAEASPETDALEDQLASGDIDGDDLAVLPDRMGRRGASGGHASVSIVGFTRPWTTGTRETGGLLVVGIPLERLAFAHLPSSGTAPRAIAREANDDTRTDATPLVNDVVFPGQVDHVQVDHVAPAAAPPTPPMTSQLVRTCVAAALRASGLDADERGIEAIVSRARWSASLPEVRLRAVQYDDQRLYTDVTTASDTSRLRDSVGAQVSLEARLTWRLDHLVFADDEPTFERIKNDRREARARV